MSWTECERAYAEGLPVLSDADVSMQQSLLRVYPGRCLGFDAREQWIEQARLLADHRRLPIGHKKRSLGHLAL
jgi:hypothetical protein